MHLDIWSYMKLQPFSCTFGQILWPQHLLQFSTDFHQTFIRILLLLFDIDHIYYGHDHTIPARVWPFSNLVKSCGQNSFSFNPFLSNFQDIALFDVDCILLGHDWTLSSKIMVLSKSGQISFSFQLIFIKLSELLSPADDDCIDHMLSGPLIWNIPEIDFNKCFWTDHMISVRIVVCDHHSTGSHDSFAIKFPSYWHTPKSKGTWLFISTFFRCPNFYWTFTSSWPLHRKLKVLYKGYYTRESQGKGNLATVGAIQKQTFSIF